MLNFFLIFLNKLQNVLVFIFFRVSNLSVFFLLSFQFQNFQALKSYSKLREYKILLKTVIFLNKSKTSFEPKFLNSFTCLQNLHNDLTILFFCNSTFVLGKNSIILLFFHFVFIFIFVFNLYNLFLALNLQITKVLTKSC